MADEKMKVLLEIVRKLPTKDQYTVLNFAKKLLSDQQKLTENYNYINLSWAGALKEYRDKYTSLELQRKALEWWGD